jgi:hypothetical protein
VYLKASKVRDRARTVLQTSARLRIGTATSKEVEALADEFAGKRMGACPILCTVQIQADNAALPKLWRGPTTSLLVTLVVRDGLLEERTIGYFIGAGAARPLVGLSERRGAQATSDEPRVRALWGRGNEKWRYTEELNPDASPDVRARYMALNLGCLSRFRGCDDAQDLLPVAVWGTPPQ